MFPMVMAFTAADTPRAIAPLWCRAMLTMLGFVGGCAVAAVAWAVIGAVSTDGTVDKMPVGVALAASWMALTAALMRSPRAPCGRGGR